MKSRKPILLAFAGLFPLLAGLVFLYACGTSPRYRGAGREAACEKAAPPPVPVPQLQAGSLEQENGGA
jgi:hypothetical protein